MNWLTRNNPAMSSAPPRTPPTVSPAEKSHRAERKKMIDRYRRKQSIDWAHLPVMERNQLYSDMLHFFFDLHGILDDDQLPNVARQTSAMLTVEVLPWMCFWREDALVAFDKGLITPTVDLRDRERAVWYRFTTAARWVVHTGGIL